MTLINTKHTALMSLLLSFLALAGIGMANTAQAQYSAPGADAGAVMQWNQQQFYMRERMPWLYGPITEKDLDPRPKEPVIEFHNMDVQGRILKKDPVLPASDGSESETAPAAP